MYDTILVATDGSPDADAAVDSALALASRFDAAVHAVHVGELGELAPEQEDDDASAAATAGREALDDFAERAADAGVAATTTYLEAGGRVHRGVVEYAADHDVDLIVMGTSGRTGLDRVVLGSAAEHTLRTAAVPVLTVHADHPLDDLDHVVVPTDGSDAARGATDHAVALAAAEGAAVHAVHVVDTGVLGTDSDDVADALAAGGRDALEAVVDAADAAGVATTGTDVRLGAPHEAIDDYAADVDADLVVMGTTGRTGLERLLLGSVTERVVRTSDVPVLGVPLRDDPALEE